VQKYLTEKFKASLTVSADDVKSQLDAAQSAAIAEADRRIAELNGQRRTWGTIQAAYDVGPPPITRLLERGNYETPGETVEPGFFHALCSDAPHASAGCPDTQQPHGPTSGRRLALARWLTDWKAPSGGLAARVMVNRVWQHLFGHGLAETTENLGHSGSPPTHPELLEWLACRFVADGGRFKPLVKLVMMSAVYRQQSSPGNGEAAASTSALAVDPGNRRLWHMPLRRLEAEIVRDAILATSGQLDPALDGPPMRVEVQSDGMVVIQDKERPAARPRRSLYVLARRNYHLSMLNVFDQPTMSTNCPNRQQSAVVLQSLMMLNDAFVLAQAEHFAARVRAEAAGDATQPRIARAFRVALSRDPSEREIAWSEKLLAAHAAESAAMGVAADEAGRQAMTHLCHMLLSSNEFLYVP
jgi:hypothetical protein